MMAVLTIKNKKVQYVYNEVVLPRDIESSKINWNSKRILQYILNIYSCQMRSQSNERRKSPHIRIRSDVMAKSLGISVRTVSRRLNDLRDMGYISWRRTGRSSMFVLKCRKCLLKLEMGSTAAFLKMKKQARHIINSVNRMVDASIKRTKKTGLPTVGPSSEKPCSDSSADSPTNKQLIGLLEAHLKSYFPKYEVTIGSLKLASGMV